MKAFSQSFVLKLFLLLILFQTVSSAHNEWVHQWMVKQAWELLKQQYPAIDDTKNG